MDQAAVNAEILRQERLEREIAGDQQTDVPGELAELRAELKALQQKQRTPALDVGKMADTLFDAVKGYVDRSFEDVHKRIGRLETELDERIDAAFRSIDDGRERLDRLEQKGGLTYRGVFQRAESYTKGDCVTFDNSMWVALAATAETPGQGRQWQLAAKGSR